MKLSISRAADEFQRNLRVQASKARARAERKRKLKPKPKLPATPKTVSTSVVLQEISSEAMQAIRTLLGGRDDSSVEIEVMDYDETGHVKRCRITPAGK